MIRQSPAATARRALLSISRATVREFDDGHLMQQVKQADVFHSETPTDFERWQQAGHSGVPLKQKKQQQGQNQSQGQNGGQSGGNEQADNYNHDQPQGEAAEAVMLYPGGNRSHPIAMVDDRRVRPYGFKEGESADYALDGSGQMLLHTESEVYLMTRNGKSYKEGSDNQQRQASLRHVDKEYQSREMQQQGGDGGTGGSGQRELAGKDHDHVGKLNTGVICTDKRIEFRLKDGSKDGKLVGYFDADDGKFHVLAETVHHKDVKVGENADRPARMQGYNFANKQDARLLLSPGDTDNT